jgi:hypothetical protein
LSGGSRKGIVQNIKHSVARILQKDVAARACEDLMKEIVRSLRGKAVFEVNSR